MSEHNPSLIQPMSRQALIDFFDNRALSSQPGDITRHERWWVDRQVALEKAGYMLRSRYRPGWKPSWADTKKHFLDCEDGLRIGVSDNSSFPSFSRANDFSCV